MGKQSAPVGIGAASIITVLLVLTLSVFSALTLSAARADLALSRRNAETVRQYYEDGALPSGEDADLEDEPLSVWTGED